MIQLQTIPIEIQIQTQIQIQIQGVIDIITVPDNTTKGVKSRVSELCKGGKLTKVVVDHSKFLQIEYLVLK